MMIRRLLLSALFFAAWSQPSAYGKTLYVHFTSLSDTRQGPRLIKDGMLLVGDDGKIEEIGDFVGGPFSAAKKKAGDVVDLKGKWLIPGFISGHTHLWQNAFRGLAPDKTLVPWIKARVEVIKKDRIAKDDFFYFTQYGVLDLLQNGVTSIFSHAQALKDLAVYAPEQFAAECRLPQRFVYGLPAKDIRYDDAKAQLEAMTTSKAQGACPSLLGLGLSDAFLFASKIAPKAVVEEHLQLQREQGLLIQDHFLEEGEESKSERDIFHQILAAPPEAAWDKLVIAHFIHPDEEILAFAAAHGVKMIWNPLSNGRLASGVPDIPGYLKRGIGIGMGLDGQASGDIADPFENMRMGLYAVRFSTQRADELSPQQMFSLHTLATAKVLGIDDRVGSLEEGKEADFLVLDPRHPPTGATAADYWARLVFAFSARNIESVFISGKTVWSRGRFRRIDADRVEREAIKRADKHIAPTGEKS